MVEALTWVGFLKPVDWQFLRVIVDCGLERTRWSAFCNLHIFWHVFQMQLQGFVLHEVVPGNKKFC